METGTRVKQEPEDELQDGPVKAVSRTASKHEAGQGKSTKGKSKAQPKAKVKAQTMNKTRMIKKNFVPKQKIRATASAKSKHAASVKVKKEPGASGRVKREGVKRGKAASVKAKQRGKPVKVKKELVVRMKVKKEPVDRSVKVKKELGVRMKVKQELKEPTGFARSPKEHYRHQVGFIEQIISGAWDVCWGGLGTGIVGVCQRGIPAEEPAEQPDESQQHDSTAAEAEDSIGGGSSSSFAPAHGRSLSRDVVIILFKNAPSCNSQSRNGRTMGCYGGGLNEEAKTLAWSSQRSDLHSRKLNTIVSHVGRSGRVLVAVRPPSSRPGTDDCDYRMLGQVSRIDGLHDAESLVEEGDPVIQERGSKIVHREIGPSCLSATLKSGVGLRSVTYDSSRWRACPACCSSPARAVLHFDYLEPVGISAYQLPKGAKLEPSESSQVGKVRPIKRIRVKRAPGEEPPGSSQSAGSQGAVASVPLGVAIKREPTDEREGDAEGVP